MPRSWPGERRVAGDAFQRRRVHGIGRHHDVPFGPLAVSNTNGDRSALGQPVPYAAEEFNIVTFKLHPGATTNTKPAAGQISGEIVARYADTGWKPFKNCDERWPVRFPSC